MSERDRVLRDQLSALAENLDLPESAYLLALERFTEIGEWLEEQDQEANRRPPAIYAQGSFRLGTMIAPLEQGAEFDVDLVYERGLLRSSTSQARLKDEAGEHLREFAQSKFDSGYAPTVREKRRCWALEWHNEPFHMDVLPAIPDDETQNESILITDTTVSYWQKSAPKDYASWFEDQMQESFQDIRQRYARERDLEIDNVDRWRVRTPLQRTIQIMKRHRDVLFEYDSEVKPASIIITTLAAHYFQNEPDLLQSLRSISERIAGASFRRSNSWYIGNPVRPEENFADRWNEDERLPAAFENWIWNLRQVLTLPVPYEDIESAFGISRVYGDTFQSVVLVPEEGDDSHAEIATWPRYSGRDSRAHIRATVHNKQNGRRVFRHQDTLAIPKHKWLKFELVTDVPPPYEIKWQITNTGPEATEANQLRGDFYHSDAANSNVRWERTLYAGTHWVQAHVVKEGALAAQSRRYSVRIRR